MLLQWCTIELFWLEEWIWSLVVGYMMVGYSMMLQDAMMAWHTMMVGAMVLLIISKKDGARLVDDDVDALVMMMKWELMRMWCRMTLRAMMLAWRIEDAWAGISKRCMNKPMDNNGMMRKGGSTPESIFPRPKCHCTHHQYLRVVQQP